MQFFRFLILWSNCHPTGPMTGGGAAVEGSADGISVHWFFGRVTDVIFRRVAVFLFREVGVVEAQEGAAEGGFQDAVYLEGG